jgi:excisionase family DNA binding protein
MITDFEQALRQFLKSVLGEVVREALPQLRSLPSHSRQQDAGPTQILLRPREAAAALAISEKTLWTLTHTGAIPHVRLNRSVRYSAEGLRQWATKSESAG